MLLEAIDVNKTIRKKPILKDINLVLESGKVYGIVGRNGSGKTMLMRALSGLMDIDSGEIRLDRRVLHRDMDVLPNTGIILENAGLYPEFTGLENLKILAAVNKKIGKKEIQAAIERVGLDPGDRRTYQKYSLGMKQRIIIAQAIMEKPDIIMLDEPTNALDAEGVDRIRMIIQEEKERGAIILLASHNQEDIRLLADEVYQMDKGMLCLSQRKIPTNID